LVHCNHAHQRRRAVEYRDRLLAQWCWLEAHDRFGGKIRNVEAGEHGARGIESLSHRVIESLPNQKQKLTTKDTKGRTKDTRKCDYRRAQASLYALWSDTSDFPIFPSSDHPTLLVANCSPTAPRL